MKKLLTLTILLSINLAHSQFLQNGSFATIHNGLQSWQNPFVHQQLGPNWYAYQNTTPNIKSNGFQNVNATDSNKFVHLWHRL